MSTYIGVRTHASEVHAAHKSRIAATNAARLAAAGLALMLSVGFSGGAHAAEGEPKKQSDPNDAAVQAAGMVRVCHLKDGRYITVATEAAERGHAEGHYDQTGEACADESGPDESSADEQTAVEQTTVEQTTDEGSGTESATEESGTESATESATEGSGTESATEESSTDEQGTEESGTDEQGGDEESGTEESGTDEQGGDEESGTEESGTDEQGGDEDQPLVLTPLPDQDTRVDVQPTKPTPSGQAGGSGDNRGEVLGVEIESSGTAKDRATPRGKTVKDTDSDPSGRDVRSAEKPGPRDEILPAATGTANRPAALVLPQTGAAANMALQAGAGLALLLGGLFTLAGRRRQDDC